MQQPSNELVGPQEAIADPAVMAQSLGGLFLAGATIGLVSLLLPRAHHTNVGALSVNIAMAYVGGMVVLFTFRRMPVSAFHGALLAGTVLITRAVYFSGDAVSFYGVWYLWAALFGFSFFKRSHAVIHVAMVGIAYGWMLTLRPDAVAAARWMTTVASLLIAGVFIDALVRRVRRQREQAAHHARTLQIIVAATQRILQAPTADVIRSDLLSAAVEVAHADGAVLWGLAPEGTALLVAASTSDEVRLRALPVDSASSGAARAYLSGEAEFSCPSQADAAALPFEAKRVLWQPVRRNDATIALLALCWRGPVPEPEQSVRAAIVLLAAQTSIAIERADLLARMRDIAHTDELTGLPNRRAWRERLPREMARAKHEKWPLCVAMLDVDGLKRVNDSLGHHAGDQLLKQNAAAWSSGLRPVDMLARYGGDEFAAILTGCRMEDAESLLACLADSTPGANTVSVGLAEWDGEEDATCLVGRADALLYAAKERRYRARAPGNAEPELSAWDA